MKGQSGVIKGRKGAPRSAAEQQQNASAAGGARPPVVILSGLQQVEEGGSGRTLQLAFCSEGQACVPATFFFVDELQSGPGKVFCPDCETRHDSITLLEALQRGRLILPTDEIRDEEASEYYGMAVKIRDLVRNAVRWTRSAEPSGPQRLAAKA